MTHFMFCSFVHIPPMHSFSDGSKPFSEVYNSNLLSQFVTSINCLMMFLMKSCQSSFLYWPLALPLACKGLLTQDYMSKGLCIFFSYLHRSEFWSIWDLLLCIIWVQMEKQLPRHHSQNSLLLSYWSEKPPKHPHSLWHSSVVLGLLLDSNHG